MKEKGELSLFLLNLEDNMGGKDKIELSISYNIDQGHMKEQKNSNYE